MRSAPELFAASCSVRASCANSAEEETVNVRKAFTFTQPEKTVKSRHIVFLVKCFVYH